MVDTGAKNGVAQNVRHKTRQQWKKRDKKDKLHIKNTVGYWTKCYLIRYQ